MNRQGLPIVLIVAAMTTADAARAQTSNSSGTERHAQVFVSNGAKLERPGGARSVLHAGVGLEWRHPRGVGLGIEAGPRFEDHDLGRLDDIMLSVDASYHIRSASKPRRVVPFLEGGFSVGWEPVSDGQQTYFVSLGGGATYRWNDRRGLRFEIRDAVTLQRPPSGYHYLGFRVGYTWRMGRN